MKIAALLKVSAGLVLAVGLLISARPAHATVWSFDNVVLSNALGDSNILAGNFTTDSTGLLTSYDITVAGGQPWSPLTFSSDKLGFIIFASGPYVYDVYFVSPFFYELNWFALNSTQSK